MRGSLLGDVLERRCAHSRLKCDGALGSGMQTLSRAAKHVGRVRKLFPEWAEEISRLALRSEAFRTMCEDYGMAVEALELLEHRNLPQDAHKMQEYRALVRELEHELKSELLAAGAA